MDRLLHVLRSCREAMLRLEEDIMSLRASLSMRPEVRLSALHVITMRLLGEPLAKLEEEIQDALAWNEFLVRLDVPMSGGDRTGAPVSEAPGIPDPPGSDI